MFQEDVGKNPEIDINLYLQLLNQDGEITAVTVFPREITDDFDAETLQEAKGNPNQLSEKFFLLRIMTSFCLTIDQIGQ